MYKYLLMSAAAAMAATIGGSDAAQASTTVFLGTSGGGSFCDYFVVAKGSSPLYAAAHYGSLSCGSQAVHDPGVKVKGKFPSTLAKGGEIPFADTTLEDIGYTHDAAIYDLTWPPSPDGTGQWAILFTTNGNSTFILNNGPQTIRKKGHALNKSSLADAIVALRAR